MGLLKLATCLFLSTVTVFNQETPCTPEAEGNHFD